MTTTLSEARLKLLRTVTEKQWRDQVRSWAVRKGWWVYFTWNSMHSPAGFPDLVLVKGERLLFVELKAETGRLTNRQEAWLEQLHQIPCAEVYVWRPHDELQVHEVLAA